MTSTQHGAQHLYVHVPFCTRRCSYCDFSIAVRKVVPVNDYLRSLQRELQIRNIAAALHPLDTVYFGGGTPSRLGAHGIASAMDIIRNHAIISGDAEVTIEANPEDITPQAVAAWQHAGVNRLSIGVQSFDDRVLEWMHRVHTAGEARVAVDVAREAGIRAFSVDLIFALPRELERDWRRDIEQALELAPDHVSLYGLTIEQGTPLGRWQARGQIAESPEERYEQEFITAHECLTAADFEHYEVSNFALPGKRARHNSAYWKGVPYVGVGPSAHGFDGQCRRWNVREYVAWAEQLEKGADPLAGQELLTEENRAAETVYLGLRTIDGLMLETPAERLRVEPWIQAGWIQAIGPTSLEGTCRIRCTPAGWLRLDSLAADLTAVRSYS